MSTNVRVEELVARMKSEKDIKRFSKNDYRDLVYGILSDDSFKAKKYLLKNDEIVENEVCYNDAMKKFMDKLLKHAGLTDASERTQVLDTFEYSAKDTEFICDVVDEAMYLYTECDKNMRIFRDKLHTMTISKYMTTDKTGNAKLTYKKAVADRMKALKKRKEKEKK